MQIITIYQGASGSGEELASKVAESLGYGPVDREVLLEASLQYGIPEAKLNEVVDRPPRWWATFTRNLEPYRIALQAAFCELAAHHGIVYHGHLGHELVPKYKHAIRILLTAPMEMRIQQVQARHELNDAAARRYVEEVDHARTRRLMAMFGVDWRDPGRYDLVVNIGYMSLETARRLIVDLAHSPDYQSTSDSRQAFEDFSLKSRAHASLLHGGDLSQARVEIHARQGEVTITGTVPEWITESQIIDIIKKVPGARVVRADLTQLSPNLGVE